MLITNILWNFYRTFYALLHPSIGDPNETKPLHNIIYILNIYNNIYFIGLGWFIIDILNLKLNQSI